MGTHPIFESDFDCLTDVCFVLNQLKMRYVAAYLLAQLGGNDAPDAAAIKAILGSVGVDADEEKMNKVISELSGKAIADVLAEGKEKLASVPSAGGAAAGGAEEAPAAEAKKESSSEDEDEDMGFGLFEEMKTRDSYRLCTVTV